MTRHDRVITSEALAALLQVVLIDLVLAGDNAVAIGLAATDLAPQQRKRATIIGIVAATVLRIILAVQRPQLGRSRSKCTLIDLLNTTHCVRLAASRLARARQIVGESQCEHEREPKHARDSNQPEEGVGACEIHQE
jgi:predicted tellurium resistance membrane protein TerC